MREATLCHPIRDGELLLMRKKRGVGTGKLIAPGGKLEPGETPREAAVRETREEVGLEVRRLEKRGELEFVFGEEPFMFVHAFVTRAFDGTPEESPEGRPSWYPLDALPYEEMWEDDRYWLPHLVDGDRFRGEFRFDAAGEELLDHDVRTGIAFDR